MNEEATRVWVPIDRAVDDPRAYHRSDDRFVNAVFSPDATVLGFYGLRRFGKTSFLRKIERICQASKDPSQSFDAEFVEMQSNADRLNERLIPLKDSLAKRLSEKTRRTIVLLDDLEQLDLCYPADGNRDASIALNRVMETLTEIIEMAKGSEGWVRVVLCEPTNFQDWLNGKISKVGPKLRGVIPESEADMFRTLPILEDYEAAYVLSGWPRDAQPGEYDASFVGSLNLALGGNPWFLAIAADSMRQNPSAIDGRDDVDNLVLSVNKKAQERNLTGMRSMYEALSKPEKLIVNILYERKKGTPAAQEGIRALFALHGGDPWSKSGARVAKRLQDLGLASSSGGRTLATGLSSEVFSEVVHSIHGPSVLLSPAPDELELWKELCKSPHPITNPPKTAIIHQFGDLFFDHEGRSKSWTSYIEGLSNLSKTAKAARDKGEDKDERPHLIVICGNLLAGYPTAGTQKSTTYTNAVSLALARLEEAVPYLQSAGEEKPASQIVIVPGILDLDWTQREDRDTLRKSYRQIWDQKVQEFGFSQPGEVHRFGLINVDLLPFDSVSLEGIEPIDDDIAEIRYLVNRNFRTEWSSLSQGGKLPRDLVKYTLEYTVPLKAGEAPPPKITETFVWRDQDPENANRRLLSEAGSVPVKLVSDMVAKLQAKLTERKGVVSIAITHHYPRQRRRSWVTEFLNPFRFRQALVNAGISMILHGHSPVQQCLFEGTPYAKDPLGSRSSGLSGDPEGAWARAMYLVGPGSFSAPGNFVLDDDETSEPRKENPTFNEIRVSRRPAQSDLAVAGGSKPQDDMYDIQINFFELADGNIRKINPNPFNFPMAGNQACTQQNTMNAWSGSGRA